MVNDLVLLLPILIPLMLIYYVICRLDLIFYRTVLRLQQK